MNGERAIWRRERAQKRWEKRRARHLTAQGLAEVVRQNGSMATTAGLMGMPHGAAERLEMR